MQTNTNSNQVNKNVNSGIIKPTVPLQRTIEEVGAKPVFQTQVAVESETEASHTVLYGLSAGLLVIIAVAAAMMLKKTTTKSLSAQSDKPVKPLKLVKISSSAKSPKPKRPPVKRSSVKPDKNS